MSTRPNESTAPNALFFGDNLEELRQHFEPESVDLVYLDPPFNSNRDYNLLFKQKKGGAHSPAQIMAFEDTWTWHPDLLTEFMSDQRNSRLYDLVTAMYRLLGGSEMMAYILMMAPRLLELHRVLKRTGSLYLHCDPVASPYLRLILDTVFGPSHFRNEITWKRTSAHNDAKQGRKAYGNIADILLYYTRSDTYTFNTQYTPYNESYTKRSYRYVEPDSGRRYRLDNLTGPGGKAKGNPYYEVMGVYRYWRYSQEKMQKLIAEGRVVQTKAGGVPAYKRYLDEMPGVALQNFWDDIKPISSAAKERSGYPTQKPLALLERILRVSSNPGDTVLDPFCGCGTAVIASELLGRRWLGIDVTWLAIDEVIRRLEAETDARLGTYTVEGTPKDETAARTFFDKTRPQNHKPFEMWAVRTIGGDPIEKRGRDRGLDGRIPLLDTEGRPHWAVVQVKGGGTGVRDIRDFRGVIERERAPFGVFLCFDKTGDMVSEAQELGTTEAFQRRIPRLQMLTFKELLEEKRTPDIPIGYIPERWQGRRRSDAYQEQLPL